jgi:hypothetical protein
MVTFDTLEFAEELESKGFSAEQAKALVLLQKKTIDQSIENQLATKQDVARVDKELAVVKWVAFATFAMVSAIFAKDFLI